MSVTILVVFNPSADLKSVMLRLTKTKFYFETMEIKTLNFFLEKLYELPVRTITVH